MKRSLNFFKKAWCLEIGSMPKREAAGQRIDDGRPKSRHGL